MGLVTRDLTLEDGSVGMQDQNHHALFASRTFTEAHGIGRNLGRIHYTPICESTFHLHGYQLLVHDLTVECFTPIAPAVSTGLTSLWGH